MPGGMPLAGLASRLEMSAFLIFTGAAPGAGNRSVSSSAVSAFTTPICTSPFLSVTITDWNPSAICALGFTRDSRRYLRSFFAEMPVRSGPASPPAPFTL